MRSEKKWFVCILSVNTEMGWKVLNTPYKTGHKTGQLSQEFIRLRQTSEYLKHQIIVEKCQFLMGIWPLIDILLLCEVIILVSLIFEIFLKVCLCSKKWNI